MLSPTEIIVDCVSRQHYFVSIDKKLLADYIDGMKTIRDALLEMVVDATKGRNLLQVANEIEGVQYGTLYRWLKGERTIDIKTAEALAKHFGLELKAKRPKR